MTERIGPRRPTQQGPETPEDNPPGTLEEIAPENAKSPMLNDRSAEPLLPVGEMSSDTPKPLSGEKKVPSDAPINPYINPDMPGSVPLVPAHSTSPVDDEPPEEWDEEVTEDLPEEEQEEPVPPS